MKKFYSLFICSLLLLISCSSGQQKEDLRPLIDNPTAQSITLFIDDTEYTVPAYASLRVDLSEGSHILKVNGETFEFEQKPYIKLLINPTNAQYVLFRESYVDTPVEENRTYHAMFKNLRIGDNNYFIPADVLNGIVIASEGNLSWNFNVDEELPEEISTQTSKSVTSINVIKNKVFRIADFERDIAPIFVLDE